MLKVNNLEVKEACLASHFPDGTQLLRAPLPEISNFGATKKTFVRFEWRYENDEELVTLMFLSKHFRNEWPKAEQYLTMYYVPNARMDRVKNIDEVFTLKYFCQVINDLGFDHVEILDPHSNVAPALLDRVEVLAVEPTINEVLMQTKTQYIYFPDEGAMKRYEDMANGRQLLVGHKKRDWDTGKIVGLEISGRNGETFEGGHFQGCSVLMIDDIISYGGTLAYSADELKRLGFKHIYAYATHVENSVLDEEKGTLLKRLNDGTVERIYTTESLYSGNHEKITVL